MTPVECARFSTLYVEQTNKQDDGVIVEQFNSESYPEKLQTGFQSLTPVDFSAKPSPSADIRNERFML
mgnify:CR=1 FL=1